MFNITGIFFSDNGKKINYDYDAGGNSASYFNPKESFFSSYESDVSSVPVSIAVVPLLANIAPIAWFAGFDIFVDEIDRDFYNSLVQIRAELEKHNPKMASVKSHIKYNSLIDNSISSDKTVMLFSGGVDAFATFFRHYNEVPALVTIQGADIELSDKKQWDDVVHFNENEPMIAPNKKHYIQSNLRTFYTYHVDLLLENLSWWGNIQHGLALISAVAPLSYVFNYKKVLIASTRSSHMEFNPWGSMPETDELISWAGVKVIHDGFDLKRQDKVDLIVDSVSKLDKDTTIRVCYSELKQDLNCSRCEKCIRTIFGIVLAGGNPSRFGFRTDASVYDLILKTIAKGFKSKGTQFFWYEMLLKGRESKNIFVFSDPVSEKKKVNEIFTTIEADAGNELKKPSAYQKLKHILIHKYPGLFNAYMKIRRAI